jgi:hypothetical protein
MMPGRLSCPKDDALRMAHVKRERTPAKQHIDKA